MSGSITIVLGDTVTHNAVLNCLNLDSTPAEGVTIRYATSDAAICDVNPVGGNLVPQAVGACVITGTGTRAGIEHSDTTDVTIESNDFTVNLTVS